MTSAASLWAGVVAIGIYHGLNPAMGWPLAVAHGLERRRGTAVFGTWIPLGVGHVLAMAIVLVPFALLAWMLEWSREIRVAAGAIVLGFGVLRLFWQRHPRALARIPPTQLTLWSFLMATAHGAALMLVPVLMGLCATPPPASAGPLAHDAMMGLMRNGAATALTVSALHTVAMIGSGLAVAWIVYRYLGLRALRGAWIDLDRVWAIGLIASGGVAIAMAV
ncbi:MAG: hypothetical protein JSR59_12570 [Proteobacteria bacterium]|nr:hypothetical protein [Pseudomonadota bacterium]